MFPFVANLLLFGRLLRRAGLSVPHSRLLDSVRALQWIGVGSRHDVRAALSALLVHRRDDLARFDQAFDLFFRSQGGDPSSLPLFSLGERPRVVARSVAAPSVLEIESEGEDGTSEPRLAIGVYSPSGVSRTKDFADFTPAELQRAQHLLARLPWRLGVRTTRRWTRAKGTRVDMRRLVRRSAIRGDVGPLPRQRRRRAPRPVVLIGDVSGSMERYSRVLLHFVYGIARGTSHAESFVFATEMTRITHLVARRGADAALARITRDVRDWGGGTRIGEALRTFNTRWARRVMRHGPVVILVSDGWDRGDPALLSAEMARVGRSCRRLIWLNPLLGSAGYEPLTRGMQAALGHVDDFLPSHNLESLEHLAGRLSALG